MLAIETLRLLDNVVIPASLDIQVTSDSNEFLDLKVQLNNSAPQLFGTAYRQGNRLHFVSGMAMRDYVKLVKIDQAAAASTLGEVREHTNRPKEASHGRDIGKYLADTACEGLPFIFPAFILNYGLNWTDDMPKGRLIIFAGPGSETLVWPAIFQPPPTGGLPVTDGGHRTDEVDKKFRNGPGRLGENAISVVFVFEEDIDQYHQDFADCAKAKAMAKSLTGSWDRRDANRRFGISLVERNAHLRKLIDATSNSVNLSTNSIRAWSMSALHASVAGLYASEPTNELGFPDSTRLSGFIDQAFTHIPILKALTDGAKPAGFRSPTPDRGGCVLLRGVGLAVLTQAYQYATKTGMAMETMAQKMGELDWYVLKPDAPPQGEAEDAYTYVAHAAQPIWKNMLAMMAGDRKYRLKGTHDAAETSFAAIRAQLGI